MGEWTVTRILKRGALVFLALFVCFFVYAFANIDVARPMARQLISTNNVKQLLLALLNYETQHRQFPPVYSAAPDGTPGLSWRVLILPYVEEEKLYKKFHLDEPWDSPHNRALIAEMPRVFRSERRRQGTAPAESGTTPYLALRGPGSVLNPDTATREADLRRKGTGNTALLVEVDEAHEVIWTKPDDLAVDDPEALQKLVVFSDCYLMGFADGSVQYPGRSLTLLELQSLVDRTKTGLREITSEEKSLSQALSRPID